MEPIIIALDGISNVGKTHIINEIAEWIDWTNILMLHETARAIRSENEDMDWFDFQNMIKKTEEWRISRLDDLMKTYNEYDIILVDRTYASWIPYHTVSWTNDWYGEEQRLMDTSKFDIVSKGKKYDLVVYLDTPIKPDSKLPKYLQG